MKRWKKEKNRDIRGLHAIKIVTEPIVTLLIDGIRNMQNIHSLNQMKEFGSITANHYDQ
jgi:hypothetical protein